MRWEFEDVDSPLRWLKAFMYYHSQGFEVRCGGTYEYAKHKETGHVVHMCTGSDCVPHLLANSLNATYRMKTETRQFFVDRQRMYRKRRRK